MAVLLERAPDLLRVASYNVHKCVGTDRRRNPERIMDVLREIDADIIALQEADRRFGAREAAIPPSLLDESIWQIVPIADASPQRTASIGWHGNALLVRRDAEILTSGVIALPTLEPRGAIYADIQLGNFALRVVGMHLDLSGIRRRQQARTIISATESRPQNCAAVLMGDLNDWSPYGGVIADFARHFRMPPPARSFHARRPVAALDRIMTSPCLHILRSGVHHSILAAKASDHLPVWADIAVDAA